MESVRTILPPARPVFCNPLSAGRSWRLSRTCSITAESFLRTLPHVGAGVSLAISAKSEMLNEINSQFLRNFSANADFGARVIPLPGFPGRFAQVMDNPITYLKGTRLNTSVDTLRSIAENVCRLTLPYANTDTVDVFVNLNNTFQLLRIYTREAAEIDMFLKNDLKKQRPPEMTPRCLGEGCSSTELLEEIERQRREGNYIHRFSFVDPVTTPSPLSHQLLTAEQEYYELSSNGLLSISYPSVLKKGKKGEGNIGALTYYAVQKNYQTAALLPQRAEVVKRQSRGKREMRKLEGTTSSLIFGKLLIEAKRNTEAAELIRRNIEDLKSVVATMTEPVVIPYVNYLDITARIKYIVAEIKKAASEGEITIDGEIKEIEDNITTLHIRHNCPIFKFYNIEEFWSYVLTLSEDRLIAEVLVPLMRNMGFVEVRNQHGERPRFEKADTIGKISWQQFRKLMEKENPRTEASKAKKDILSYFFRELGHRGGVMTVGGVVKRTKLQEMKTGNGERNVYQALGDIVEAFDESVSLQEEMSTADARNIIDGMSENERKAAFQTMRAQMFFDRVMYITPYDVREEDAILLARAIHSYLKVKVPKPQKRKTYNFVKIFFEHLFKDQFSATLVDGFRLRNWIKWFMLDGKEKPILYRPGFGIITSDSTPEACSPSP